jgi:hypothetical protein
MRNWMMNETRKETAITAVQSAAMNGLPMKLTPRDKFIHGELKVADKLHRKSALHFKGSLIIRSLLFIFFASFLLSSPAEAEQILLKVIEAKAEIYRLSNSPAIAFQLSDASASDFEKFTRKYLGRSVLYRIENQDIMTVRIVTVIGRGILYLTDIHDLLEAEKLSGRLNAGVPLLVTTLSNVSNEPH